jgi:hypothetical protein
MFPCWLTNVSCSFPKQPDHEVLKKEQENYKAIEIIRKLDNTMVQRNYLQIKQDVQDIIQSEMEKLLNDPGQSHLIIRKG